MEKQKPTQSKAAAWVQEVQKLYAEIFGAKPGNDTVGQTFVTFINKPKKPRKSS